MSNRPFNNKTTFNNKTKGSCAVNLNYDAAFVVISPY